MSHLGYDAQFLPCRLCVREHRHLLHLLARLACRRESHRDIPFFAGFHLLTRIIGHRAPAAGLTSANQQVGIAVVAEMETLRNTLARG